MEKVLQNTTSDGFYAENELKRQFHIPKRKSEEISTDKNVTTPYNMMQTQTHQTPLANSYYNYSYDPGTSAAYYGNYAQYYSQYPAPGNITPIYKFNVAPPPPPPPPENSIPTVDPIKQNIYKALKDIKEKPKNYKQNIFESTAPDIADSSLPKDLKLLFQPLFCKLCTAQLSSNQSAKMHYKSKNHEKKIRKWLIEYSEKSGEPLHKRARVSNEKQSEGADKNPAWFHCDVCDLQLTGRLHAESHYMGKNHQKALLGYKAPAGQGYYDATGKWVRTNPTKSKLYNFENGEDNFGAAFKATVPKTSAPREVPSSSKKEAIPTAFHCDVCNINTTCQDQLDNHYRGQKHLKKLKQLGMTNYSEQREIIEAIVTPTVEVLTEKDLNLSVYRTPSGDYYCPSCNSTSNSEGQFLQHWTSKNHMKKASQKRNNN
ncbi:zinc finger matrin-type protein 3-like [Sitophilus oryzae]|uniref:Zinc finger matrin-type protein 3-like n=1 Tax=Sitophilus oryzae TaxID=7048 RepID=A0A6J2XTX8_SITOR|nr:zinc finger matrin-type protein 3-like [Sitophilus oryzae]